MRFLDSWVRKAFGHAVSVGLVRELLVALGEIVLAVGMLNMSQEPARAVCRGGGLNKCAPRSAKMK